MPKEFFLYLKLASIIILAGAVFTGVVLSRMWIIIVGYIVYEFVDYIVLKETEKGRNWLFGRFLP
jgi:hypothetical protein